MKKFFERNFFISLCHPFNRKKRRELRYNINLRYKNEIHQVFLEKSPKALLKLSELINNYDKPIKVWLEFGTLLGYYRENGIISHDEDIDFGIEESENVHDFICYLNRNGFKLSKMYTIKSQENSCLEDFIAEYNVKFEQYVSIDFFVFKTKNSKKYSYHFDEPIDKIKPYKFIVNQIEMSDFGLIEGNFLGGKFFTPDNIEKHLSSIYGRDFMTPKKYSYQDRDKNNEIVLPHCYAVKKDF